MAGINATYDGSLDPKARDAIKDMINTINSTLPTRDVNLHVTSNISQVSRGNWTDALNAANHTSTKSVKNDTLFVNKNFDYSQFAVIDVQSWMHELVHVAFPNVAGTVKGHEELHEEEFYEKLALVSDLVGVKFSASDLGKWVQQLKALGLPDKSIQAIVEDYADTNPANDVHCFLADTPILLADGTEKPIQEIAPGDMVMSFDPKANSGLGGRKPGRVRRTFRNTTRQVIDLRGLRIELRAIWSCQTTAHGSGLPTCCGRIAPSSRIARTARCWCEPGPVR